MTAMNKPQDFVIRIEGVLPVNWSDWFEGLEIRHLDNETLLKGSLDQAALIGMLTRVHSLNLTLVSVNRVDGE